MRQSRTPTYPHNLETQLGTIGFLDLDGPAARVSICQLTESGYETVEVTALPAGPPPPVTPPPRAE